jgi:hypothetical protein
VRVVIILLSNRLIIVYLKYKAFLKQTLSKRVTNGITTWSQRVSQ